MKKANEESRLDRIEMGLELLLQGTSELKDSQKKTDAQILDLKDSQKKTDEQLWKTDKQILDLKDAQKKTDAQLWKTDEQILDLKDSQKKTDEQLWKTDKQILDLKDSQKKTDEQLGKTIKKLDEIGRQLGDLGLVQGEVAEDLFYRNVRHLFKEERDLIFADVKRNLKKKGAGEYDIVAVNGDAVLVIEVKNKLQTRMVDRFVEKKLPLFKKIFPEYQGRRVFGGIGALVVKDAVGRYAEKAGVYVLTQTSDGGAGLVNRKNFRAKEFS